MQTFEPVRLGAVDGDAPRLRHGGVYLITGGLGQIGLALAEYLAKTVQAKLVLTARSALPERTEWDQWLTQHGDDDVSDKLRKLLALEEHGAEVMVCSADAADRDQMRQVINQVYERFGAIHGVIHGAGNTAADAFYAVNQTDPTAGERHFRPKVQGLLVLEELLHGKELDFCLLLSSLSAVLGGLGLCPYAAANLFMDAFASQQNRANAVPWISVNWDAWKFPQDALPGSMMDFILPQEGVEAFARILDRAPRQIVVAAGDLQARFEQWINLKDLGQTQQSRGAQVATLLPRPNLSSAYVAPTTERGTSHC